MNTYRFTYRYRTNNDEYWSPINVLDINARNRESAEKYLFFRKHDTNQITVSSIQKVKYNPNAEASEFY